MKSAATLVLVLALTLASTVQATVIYSQDFEGLNTSLLTGQDSWVDGWAGWPQASTTVEAQAGGLMDPASTQVLRSQDAEGAYFNNERALPGTYTAANTDWISLSFDASGWQEFKMSIGSDATGYADIEINGPYPKMIAGGPAGWFRVVPTTGQSAYRMKILIDFANNKINAFYDADAADIQAGVYDGNDVDGASLYVSDGSLGTGADMVNNGTFNSGGTAVNLGATAGMIVDTIRLYLRNPAGTAPGYLDNILVEIVPEPATLALLGIGGLAMLIRRRR